MNRLIVTEACHNAMAMLWITAVVLISWCVLVVKPVRGHEKPAEEVALAVIDLPAAEFDEFINRPGVQSVYFFKKDRPRLKFFREEYEKSAQLLKPYGVQCAWVDCGVSSVEKYCSNHEADSSVYTFRSGHELLVLGLENMFDIDSIMSNLLQIVLLRDVPIVQTLKERGDLIEKNKKTKDIIFSYLNAIGTHEHRVLMEVAYAYRGAYVFAITTEFEVVHDLDRPEESEEMALWLLSCKNRADIQLCGPSKYYGLITMDYLPKFVRMLSSDAVHEAIKDDKDPFQPQHVDEVVIYYEPSDRKRVMEIADLLVARFRGQIGILLVDVSDEIIAEDMGYAKSFKLPHLTFAPGHTSGPYKETEVQMQEPLTEETAYVFVLDKLEMLKFQMTKDKNAKQAEQDSASRDSSEFVEKQDDQVAEAVYRLRKEPFDRQYIPALTDKTFPVETKNQDLLVVFFYLHFCARSMAFMRSYVEASHVLVQEGLQPLAGVDCYDWTDVCGKNNISLYPTIRIYRKGQEPIEYKGMLDGGAIVATVRMLRAGSPILLKSVSEVNSFKKGELPESIGLATNVSVLGLFSTGSRDELTAFKEAAMMLEGKQVFGYAVGDVAVQISGRLNAAPPSVVVIKRHDSIEPHVVDHQMAPSLITQFVQEAALPVFPELNAVNFPAYYSRKQPFVILFGVNVIPGEGEHKVLGDIVKNKMFTHVTFAWMELLRKDGVADRVLDEYDSDAKPPIIAVTNHQQGTIHLYNDGGFTVEFVADWLKQVFAGTLAPTKMMAEGEWKPLNPGYDFLKMMDEDLADDQQSYPEETGEVEDEEVEETTKDPEEVDLSSLKNSRLFHTTESKSRHRVSPATTAQPVTESTAEQASTTDFQHAHGGEL